MVFPKRVRDSKDINSIIEARRNSDNLRDIPNILVPVWQLKIRERFGINIDREVAEYIVLAAHERGTWRRQRATRKIEKLLISRGLSREESASEARLIIDLAIGNPEK
ncbi:MAG: hypothetical protein LVQ96_01080 [Thermoplasmatales archaeon]|nr:hypothetical protein [Thermoplasmatales archaeon]MCW6169749.1 hypothetical protein [Thermoplasmatales archaeon]